MSILTLTIRLRKPEPPPAGQYVAPNDAELADLIRRIPALLRG